MSDHHHLDERLREAVTRSLMRSLGGPPFRFDGASLAKTAAAFRKLAHPDYVPVLRGLRYALRAEQLEEGNPLIQALREAHEDPNRRAALDALIAHFRAYKVMWSLVCGVSRRAAAVALAATGHHEQAIEVADEVEQLFAPNAPKPDFVTEGERDELRRVRAYCVQANPKLGRSRRMQHLAVVKGPKSIPRYLRAIGESDERRAVGSMSSAPRSGDMRRAGGSLVRCTLGRPLRGT